MAQIKMRTDIDVNCIIIKTLQNYLDVGGLQLHPIRTVRVSYDGTNALPAGLGMFPLYKVKDFRSGVPKAWNDEFYFMPVYQSEAMWINFARNAAQPYAVIIAAGTVNAIDGKEMKKASLIAKPQNYLVTPPQPWIDGWKNKDGTVSQFVGTELGKKETMEYHVTGKETKGGIQIAVFTPKPGKNLTIKPRPQEHVIAGAMPYEGFDMVCDVGEVSESCALDGISASTGHEEASAAPGTYSAPNLKSRGIKASASSRMPTQKEVRAMGLGKGGNIIQQIYDDPYGIRVWNKKPSASTCLYMVSSEVFKQITGYNPPHEPLNEHIPAHTGSNVFKGAPKVSVPGEKTGDGKPVSEEKDVFQKI